MAEILRLVPLLSIVWAQGNHKSQEGEKMNTISSHVSLSQLVDSQVGTSVRSGAAQPHPSGILHADSVELKSPEGASSRSLMTMIGAHPVTTAGAFLGATASVTVIGPPMAEMSEVLGKALGTVSGIFAGSVLGGIVGGSVGTYVAMKKNQSFLPAAGIALTVGLTSAACGGAAGAFAGPAVGAAVAKTSAYALSAILGGVTGGAVTRAFTHK
jgi:hypothetical protein